MAYDPILKVFKKDYEMPNRSNWQLDNKNRLSMDFGYLYPVAVYDVLPNSYFKLDINAVLSSNPTLAPLLGSLKFRAEAFFVEKAAYAKKLRQNNKLPVDRNIPWPTFWSHGNLQPSSVTNTTVRFSPATGLLEHLNMYPVNWSDQDWALRNSATEYPDNFEFPALNAIPFIMYHDIYRNYYINVQDDKNIPIRNCGYTIEDGNILGIEDKYVSRENFDDFVESCIAEPEDVELHYFEYFGLDPFARVDVPPVSLQNRVFFNHQRYLHHGLLRRTLNNDFFTSYLSNENVELMRNYSKIDTSAGHITVEQISIANRNWRFATRSLLWGTDWSDYNRVHFGTKVVTRYGKPQFLGAISSDVIFSDVVSQTQSSEENINTSLQSNRNLGSRAGLAFGNVTNYPSNKKDYKPFVEFTTEEEGYVMVLLSLVPEVNYFQGVDPMFFKTNLNQSYSPEYNAYGMQDFHKVWASALPIPNPSNGPTYGLSYEKYNEAIHKVPIWFEYMARYNQLHGLFTLDEQYKYWTFSRAFTQLTQYFDNIVDGDADQAAVGFWDFYNSTYVLPEMYNYIFANNVGTDNFQCQIKLDCFQKQLLDKQIVAYL